MLKKLIKWVVSPLRPNNKGDLKIIAFCGLVATVFWVFNALNRNFNTQIKYPIQISYDKNTIMPIDKVRPSYIRLNVSSFGWSLVRKGFLSSISPLEMEVVSIPESNYITSSSFKPILANRLRGVKINSVEEDTIQLNIRYIAEKKVLIKVDSTHISLASGFHIKGPIRIEPNTVVFKGPREAMAEIPDTLRIMIASKNIDANHEEKVKIHHLHNEFLKVDKKKITVSFDVSSTK
ncbi:MAG: hypothetical protein RL060_1493 [Bacteroidota bacterium]|jgi:YbbR domain-containing protein